MLKDKHILITGSAQGIGLACASLCAKNGAHVIMTDIDDAKGALAADTLCAQGLSVTYEHLDVADESQWQQLMEKIQKLDGIINNAGITGFDDHSGPQDPEHASLASWHQVHHVNLDGTFLGCQHAIRVMKQNGGGSIVNMSSRSGIVGIPAAAAYASSKAAIRNHSKTVALWCAQNNYNIRCNSIHPAAILTPMWDAMLGNNPEAAIKAISHDIPLKRMGMPREVAELALYLLSDQSQYITGSEFHIDGGILAGSTAAPAAASE
jgi:3(or 17)beta-hydroxysteroid dehydrogenase